MAGCIRFQQIAPRAGLEQLLDQRLAVMHRKDQNFCLGQTRPNLPRRLHAVDARQRIVEDGNVRLGFRRLGYRLLAVGSLGNDLPVWLRGENSAEARTNDLVVICNQNAHRSCLLLSVHLLLPVASAAIDALCRHPRKPRNPSEVNALGITPGTRNTPRGSGTGPDRLARALFPGQGPSSAGAAAWGAPVVWRAFVSGRRLGRSGGWCRRPTPQGTVAEAMRQSLHKHAVGVTHRIRLSTGWSLQQDGSGDVFATSCIAHNERYRH